MPKEHDPIIDLTQSENDGFPSLEGVTLKPLGPVALTGEAPECTCGLDDARVYASEKPRKPIACPKHDADEPRIAITAREVCAIVQGYYNESCACGADKEVLKKIEDFATTHGCAPGDFDYEYQSGVRHQRSTP